jgi:DNA polymerase I
VIDFQALVGDSVDNVPGVQGSARRPPPSGCSSSAPSTTSSPTPTRRPGGPKIKQALKDAIANGNLAKSKTLVTLDRRRAMKFDWEGWKRKDWDGQRLLELFQEFGFRGFAERVRKTLAASGAKKNAEALEAAGVAPERASPRRARDGPHRRGPVADNSRRPLGLPAGGRRTGQEAPPLFDQIDEIGRSTNRPDDPVGSRRRRLELRRLHARRHAERVRWRSSRS